jgi:hypothetical protein
MDKDYRFDVKNRFIIENYHEKRAFSSFLPGIAGLKGIPMWAFYVNRGQGISSFGIRDKDSSIMEFSPAYKAYQTVEYTGFRTFIKICEEESVEFYEPFSNINPLNMRISTMYIASNELELEDTNEVNGLKTNVIYFTLPNEEIAALVRKVTVTNISHRKMELEIVDGMPSVIPFGLENSEIKKMGHTLRAWMDVYNLENKMPFYKIRASAGDTSEVADIEEGHFYLSFSKENNVEELLEPIVDADIIFGNNTSLSYPTRFMQKSIEELLKEKQITVNKIPSAFSLVKKTLEPGESVNIYSLIGHTLSVNNLENLKEKLVNENYIQTKNIEARQLIENLTEEIYCKTSNENFDKYCKQTYLDNFIRGGYPLEIKTEDKSFIYYVYSRKHGDLERDYNFFKTEPEFYSSGNGNFRDVNQNRRCDVLFHPEVKDFNITTFMNLIQTDGYNPLVLKGYRFIFKKCNNRDTFKFLSDEDYENIQKFLKKPFTLGELYKYILEGNLYLKGSCDKFVTQILKYCEQTMSAEHGEGYWSDHWTYNLDSIESFLSVFPDEKKQLLFDFKEYTYFDNTFIVKTRDDKYVLSKGKVRQDEGVHESTEKVEMIGARREYENVVRTKKGQGEIYKSNLLSKLIILAINKFSLLDPRGMGIEMEAGKPGWDDALNGLPGMFGSSMAESYELLRLLNFIAEVSEEYIEEKVKIPVEVSTLVNNLSIYVHEFNLSSDSNKDYIYWDKTSKERENYRQNTVFGFEGQEALLCLRNFRLVVNKFITKLSNAIELAYNENNQMYPCFFYYEAVEYELIYTVDGKQKFSDNRLPLVKVNSFTQNKMPLFLEGTVRGLKNKFTDILPEEVYKKIKESTLFDKKLKMYKINESLDGLPIDVGRLRAFTPGWLENETIWLHMEYKYMLEILNNNLYEEFFSDFKNVLIPFMDSNIYGRSILENSSFIASSANEDETTHGVGYVARLSGASAEFLSIWNIIMSGKNPFFMQDNELCLKFEPILPQWLFDERNRICFNFLGKTLVTYDNPLRKDTYKNTKLENIILHYENGKEVEIQGELINEPFSRDIREGKVKKIHIKIS